MTERCNNNNDGGGDQGGMRCSAATKRLRELSQQVCSNYSVQYIRDEYAHVQYVHDE